MRRGTPTLKLAFQGTRSPLDVSSLIGILMRVVISREFYLLLVSFLQNGLGVSPFLPTRRIMMIGLGCRQASV